jgi:hypothetical protein
LLASRATRARCAPDELLRCAGAAALPIFQHTLAPLERRHHDAIAASEGDARSLIALRFRPLSAFDYFHFFHLRFRRFTPISMPRAQRTLLTRCAGIATRCAFSATFCAIADAHSPATRRHASLLISTPLRRRDGARRATRAMQSAARDICSLPPAKRHYAAIRFADIISPPPPFYSIFAASLLHDIDDIAFSAAILLPPFSAFAAIAIILPCHRLAGDISSPC